MNFTDLRRRMALLSSLSKAENASQAKDDLLGEYTVKELFELTPVFFSGWDPFRYPWIFTKILKDPLQLFLKEGGMALERPSGFFI